MLVFLNSRRTATLAALPIVAGAAAAPGPGNAWKMELEQLEQRRDRLFGQLERTLPLLVARARRQAPQFLDRLARRQRLL